MKFLKKIIFVICLFGIYQNIYAEEQFVIDDIILKGLQRVDPGTVYTYLPIEVGDAFDESMTPSIIKTLFKTKFFEDVVIERDGNVLIITLDERPTIADIEFSGVEGIDDEQLDKILDAANIAAGRIYDSSVLDRIKSELREQNFARGMYSVEIDVQEKMLEDNRVFLKVVIREGARAKIKQVKITGNRAFSDKMIKKDFGTVLPTWYMFWSESGVYSSPVLGADLELLKSFYLDKGFMDFSIESSQVTLSKNKQEVYITININEGERYVINEINVSGKLILSIEEIANLLEFETGEYISREKLLKSSDNIKKQLSKEGYAFARINPVPEKILNSNDVNISFFIDPGNRTYIRRINITGNITTQDEVFRREIRQMESSWYSLDNIEESKSRIQRLAFVESVRVDEVRVIGSSNKIDLNVKIVEKMSGNFNIGAGFGGSGTGFELNAGIEQDNFLGFGSKVSFSINTAKTTRQYMFNFFNPYHNIDAVSRSFGFNVQKTKTDNTDTVTDYEADRIGLDYAYGLPMTANNRFNLTLKYFNWEIRSTGDSSSEIVDFIAKNGDSFDNFSTYISYGIDTRDRRNFTRSGFSTGLSAEIFVPGSDLEYYKVKFRTDSFFEVSRELDLVVRLRGRVNYGQGYGGTPGLPFYDKFKAGGHKTVRGYKKNSLSPHDSADKPLGGDFMVAGTAEVIVRPPIDVNNLRAAFFIDFGRAFKDYDSFEFGDVKGSAGLSVKWVSPFGGVSLSWSLPLNDEIGDETESFQFNLGTN